MQGWKGASVCLVCAPMKVKTRTIVVAVFLLAQFVFIPLMFGCWTPVLTSMLLLPYPALPALPPDSHGLLYAFYGPARILRSGILSALSVREVAVALPIALVTTPDSLPELHALAARMTDLPLDKLFTYIILSDPAKKEFMKNWKIHALALTPFGHTLFLDADTFVCRDPSALFALTRRVDLAAVQRFRRVLRPEKDIPVDFLELNTGVLLYRNTTDVQDFLRRWELGWSTTLGVRKLQDQRLFRKTLWEMPHISFTHLSPEWNCRYAVDCNEAVMPVAFRTTALPKAYDAFGFHECRVLHSHNAPALAKNFPDTPLFYNKGYVMPEEP